MPYVGFGLHILIAIMCAVHAVRSGRNLYWLIILFSFPLLGSLVYFLVEMWPEMRASRTSRQARHAVRGFLDPGTELREAQEAVEISPTANNHARLAEVLRASGDAKAASEHYHISTQGLHGQDPHLLYGLASAEFEDNQPGAARESLERIRDINGKFPTQEGHLLYARTLAILGDTGAAQREFADVVTYFNSPEAKCRYAQWLIAHGDRVRATALFEDVVKGAKLWSARAKGLHRDWLRQVEDGLRS